MIEKKTSYKLLSEKYGIGISTISDIKKKGGELKSYKRKLTEMGCQRPAKTMKLGRDSELEEAVFLWFTQQREKGKPEIEFNFIHSIIMIFIHFSNLKYSLIRHGLGPELFGLVRVYCNTNSYIIIATQFMF